MRKYKKLLCVALTLSVGALAWAKMPSTADGATASSIKPILVNGKINISAAEQEAMISALVQQGQERNEQLEGRVRYALVQNAVLVQMARDQGIHKMADVQKEVKSLTDQVLIRTLLANHLKKNPVTDKEVRALYDKQKAQWGSNEVQLRHILLKDEETAKRVLKRVQKGEKFEKLAKELSLDTEQNRKQGGFIDWISPNVLGSEIGAAVSVMSPGQLASTPVKSRLGWHVLKLEARRDAQRWKNYEAHKAQLTEVLRNQKTQAFIQGVVQKAKIEINPKSQKKTK